VSARREVTGAVGCDKDMEKALRIVRKAGWRVYMTGGNHLLVLGPEPHQRCTLSLSTNGGGTKAGLRQLRKAGAPV